jgi:rhodanese-related sulfurtransferase
MKKSLIRASLIVLLGIGAGLGANQISLRRLPLITPAKAAPAEFIALEQAKLIWQGGAAFFLDAREPADYAAGHIGNAFNLPAQSFTQHFGRIAPMLTPESELILYCDGKDCDLSHRLAATLRQHGYTNIHILFNGWTEWREARLPITPGVPE